MKARDTAIIIFVFMVLLAHLLWYFGDAISDWSMTGDAISAATVYLLVGTPANIALLLLLYDKKKIRGLVAGLFMIIAFDIMSLAHYIRQSGVLPVDPSSYFGYDTIFYKLLYPAYPLGTYGLYVLTVITMFLISLEILGYISFVSTLKKVVGAS